MCVRAGGRSDFSDPFTCCNPNCFLKTREELGQGERERDRGPNRNAKSDWQKGNYS